MRRLSVDFFKDGHSWWGLLAPFISVSSSVAKLAGWQPLSGVPYIWALLPITIWLGVAYIMRRGAYYAIIGDELDEAREMNIHQFLDYIGITVGDVSNKNIKLTEDALRKLRRLAKDGHITIWGTQVLSSVPNAAGSDYLPERISRNYWFGGLIYAPDAVEDRDPMKVRTVRMPIIEGAPTVDRFFDCLYFSRLMIKRHFKKNEFKSTHAPSFRRKSP